MTDPEHTEQTTRTVELDSQPEETKVIALGGAATIRVGRGEDWPGRIQRSESRPYFA